MKGKLFNDGKIEFKGFFLRGRKWHGKGYDTEGNVIYELANGNGKIREFAKKGTLIYEGEYLNWKKQGKGIEYDYYENKIYEGEYLNGIRHGKGKEYDKDENKIYEGEYLEGKRHGKGIEYDNQGDAYEVEYYEGKKVLSRKYLKGTSKIIL